MKKLILKFYPLLFLLIILGCNDNSNPINNENEITADSIRPQIQIPWNSLANTPWPMYHHDSQSTGRSDYAGPENGTIEHIHFDNCHMTMSGITIGYNNTAFLPSGDFSNYFFAFDLNGILKWERQNISSSTPLVSLDSSVYISSVYGTLTSFSHSGDTLWNTLTGKTYHSNVIIDKAGNLYVTDIENDSDVSLKVFDKNGKLKWKFNNENYLIQPYYNPSFSPDGNTIYLIGRNVSLLAIDINSQNLKWVFEKAPLESGPVIDNDGNIYIIPLNGPSYNDYVFYSINPQGEINWQYEFKDNVSNQVEPTIDYYGNIYFGGDTLYSISYYGKIRWKRYLDGGHISASLICDINNVIYCGIVFDTDKIYAVNSDGSIKWKILDLGFRTLGAGPALSNDGRLFFPSWRNHEVSFSIIR